MCAKRITGLECAIIIEYMNQMITYAESALSTLRETPPVERSDTLKGMITYWRHARSAYRFARTIAHQRSEERTNGK